MQKQKVIIIGSGIAGLYAALSIEKFDVLIVSNESGGKSGSSYYAQGGIAAAIAEDDDFETHVQDTIKAGAGLVDYEVAKQIILAGTERVHHLAELGVNFKRDEKGNFNFGREAAHSKNRILHINGDASGKEIMNVLNARVSEKKNIQTRYTCEALEISVYGSNVNGIWIKNEKGETEFISASNIILATGGVSALYSKTTNPLSIYGKGLGLAARAGAVIADAEFVQFHPTALDLGVDPVPLATEALRGEGAIIINEKGERFLDNYHPAAELAPRDIVSRAVFSEISKGNKIFLDATNLKSGKVKDKFPNVYNLCKQNNIDADLQPIPIAPAAHYHVGGIATNINGRSSINGLWACGEVACTGFHGANRLASNSLLESIVLAYNSAKDVEQNFIEPASKSITSQFSHKNTNAISELEDLRNVMMENVGIERSEASLKKALHFISELMKRTSDNISFLNVLTTASMITKMALEREESRGCHYRSDYPETKEVFKRRCFEPKQKI